jgi:hypothetical protein
MPKGREVWPPGSQDINPFDYLKCGVSRRGINRSSYKKNQSLITIIKEFFSNIPGRPPIWHAAASGPG